MTLKRTSSYPRKKKERGGREEERRKERKGKRKRADEKLRGLSLKELRISTKNRKDDDAAAADDGSRSRCLRSVRCVRDWHWREGGGGAEGN